MSATSALYTSESLKAAHAPAFSSMEGKLDPSLLAALSEMKFDFMTPVQAQVLNGDAFGKDCLVQAKTGTGKTTAFLLPAIQHMLQNSPPRGQVAILILSPTRELALQIAAEAMRLVSRFKRKIAVHTAFGGTAKASNLKEFKQGDPKILVATPGRLNDYLSEFDVRAKFAGMRTLILDEADRMLDAGFLPDILKVLHALPPKRTAQGTRQWNGMCFSATIPPKMRQVFSHVLHQDYVSVSTIDAAVENGNPTLAKVPQFSVVMPDVRYTFNTLFALLKEEISITEGEPKIIVFGTTANLVALYAKIFQVQFPLQVYELHSRLSQAARTRATDAFKIAKNGIMFASDVIGRGMDFPDVSLVVQVGVPADADAYTHRVGRTARAGKDGRAVVLLTQQESFFLRANHQFPIKPYPASKNVVIDSKSPSAVNDALRAIDPLAKQKAYSAYLGFMKGNLNKMQMGPRELVHMANDFALEGMLCDEQPTLEKRTIGKMGLKGVPGIIYSITPRNEDNGHTAEGGRPSKRNIAPSAVENPSRRLRHQGVPGSTGNAFASHSHGNQNKFSKVAPNDRHIRNLEGSMREGRNKAQHPGTLAKMRRKEKAVIEGA